MGNADRVRHLVLDFRGVLGRAVDQHVAVILRDRQRGLAFQIEVLLPAHLKATFDDVGGRVHRRGRVAAGPYNGTFFEPAVGGQCVVDTQNRRARVDGDLPRRAALRAARWLVATTRKIGWP